YLYALARDDAQLPFDNHPVPGFDATFDRVVHAIVIEDVHGAHLRAAVGADHEHVAGFGTGVHGIARHHDGIGKTRERHLGIDELAGHEAEVAIVETRAQLDGARFCIHLIADEIDGSSKR